MIKHQARRLFAAITLRLGTDSLLSLGRRPGPALQVVERLSLGGGRSLCIVRLEARRYLMGLSADRIEFLEAVPGHSPAVMPGPMAGPMPGPMAGNVPGQRPAKVSENDGRVRLLGECS